ncbi:hypothetical protein [Bifidobacterium longum]|nr:MULTISPECIES: hypothetical protein [Bifidobacterium]
MILNQGFSLVCRKPGKLKDNGQIRPLLKPAGVGGDACDAEWVSLSARD